MGYPYAGSTLGPSKGHVLLGSQAAACNRCALVTHAAYSSRAGTISHAASVSDRTSNIACATGPSNTDTASDRVETPALCPRTYPKRVGT